MNAAHLHLVLNHFPLIAMPTALVFLLHSFRTKNLLSRRFALWVLGLAALLVLPVYLTGEGAEEIVENLPEIVKTMIHDHEEAAELSLVLTLITGSLSLGALAMERVWRKASVGEELIDKRTLVMGAGLVILTLLSTGSLAWTANLGGKIRHVEVRSDFVSQVEDYGMPKGSRPGHDED